MHNTHDRMTIKLKDIDLIFVSYDEPGKEVFCKQAEKIWPGTVRRIDGVKGIHSAYSAANEIATTEWFLIVDGDTWIWDTIDFDALSLPAQLVGCVYSFGSINEVNRLCYGNGGPKLWKKDLITTGTTHEKTNDGVSVDFFTTFKYYQVDSVFSTTVINQTPIQAVRAGYRECAKFLSQNGKNITNWKSAISTIAASNLSRVHVWGSTGADVNNGLWAMYGARRGIVDFWATDNENDSLPFKKENPDRYLILNDYQQLTEYLTEMTYRDQDPYIGCNRLGKILDEQLDFYIPLHDEKMSKWVKTIYQNPSRNGFI